MAFLAWLRKVQRAVHNCADAVRRAEERKRNQLMPRNDPLEVRAVVSFDQETVAYASAQDNRNYAIQKSIKNATWWAFGAVTAYAVVTAFMWCSMIEQTGLSKISIEQTKVQWQAQNRPWVGVSGPLALPRQLIFLAFSGNRPHTGVKVSASLSIKDFGISPAFKAGSDVELLLTNNTLNLPKNEPISACSAADQLGIGESVIFPNTEIVQGFEVQQNQPIALQQVQRLWAIGCISYFDQVSNSTRHTKFWIVSQVLQDNIKPSFMKHESRAGQMVDFYSLPVSGWLLLKTEAD